MVVIIPRRTTLQVLVEGQAIRHEQYGMGVVTESNNERTTIDFDNHGMKKFITSIWAAELVGEAPTERPAKRRGRRKTAKKAS
ncbi:MAG: hypothetical protein ACREQC_16495 [Candidatus Binataceae bacterium]